MPFSARQGLFFQPVAGNRWQDLTDAEILADVETWSPTGTATANSVVSDPLSPYGNAGFRPMVAHPNGKIYIGPCLTSLSDKILEFDPETNTLNEITMPGVNLTGSVKYNSGCLGSDNRIYFAPIDAPEFLVVDPENNNYYTSSFGQTFSGGIKFSAMVAKGDKVYAMGSGSGQPYVLIIDVVNQTSITETYGGDSDLTSTTTLKYTSGCHNLKNGKLYFGPYQVLSRSVLVIDTETETVSKIGGPTEFGNEYTQGVGNDRDGNVIMAAHNSGNFYKINTDDDTLLPSSADDKCVGVKLGVDGATYAGKFFGAGSGMAVVEGGDFPNVNVEFSTELQNAYWGSCLHPNGKQYVFPNNTGNDMYELDMPGTGLSSELLDRIPFTPYFNYTN